ncbi:MAG TPA: AmpG family muropeptide MFS transporter [Candidatus Binataceae bacterium]|nr:AmpG family muropeptide MFS transporter [Candidatus Binataceae bacterium]
MAARLAGWRKALKPYAQPRVLLILPLGFASGLPLLLTFSTLSAWLATVGVSRAAIGAFALAGTPYALKFVWSPLIDRLPPPIPLGRRRGWGLAIQLALIVAILALGACDPRHHLRLMGILAVTVAFLSASQDIVIDAYRVELLTEAEQGPGAGMVQTGYRIATLFSGAGALLIAARAGWFTAYAAMAALLVVGLITFALAPEPQYPADPLIGDASTAAAPGLRRWIADAVIGPFADFMERPRWLLILVFVVAYKLGEALAGVMATPLYVALGFTLAEIAAVSKLFGFVATIIGALIGGVVAARLGVMRALLVCGVLQSAGNLFYVLQALGGHRLEYLALCVTAENLTGAMAGAALVAYLSDLCSPAFTATQYALLSSLSAVGRTLFAASAGVLAQYLGWAPFFLLTTVVTIPALMLLLGLASPHKLEAGPWRDSLEGLRSTRNG